MRLAPWIEHSACCLFCGKFGLSCAGKQRPRKRLLSAGILLNTLALLLTIVAAIGGLSISGGTLRPLRWVHGRATLQVSNLMGANVTLSMDTYMGIRARYDVVNCSGVTKCSQLMSAKGFTPVGDGSYEHVLNWDDESTCRRLELAGVAQLCEQCKDSLFSQSSLVLGILTSFPTIATDLQRATLYGDVNCQATMGFISNLISLVSTMVPLLLFRKDCYSNMPEAVSSPSGSAPVEWHVGIGFQCLIIATLVKVFDALFHAMIPTPREKWVRPPEGIVDVEDYMALSAPRQKDAPPAKQEMPRSRSARTVSSQAAVPATDDAGPTLLNVVSTHSPLEEDVSKLDSLQEEHANGEETELKPAAPAFQACAAPKIDVSCCAAGILGSFSLAPGGAQLGSARGPPIQRGCTGVCCCV